MGVGEAVQGVLSSLMRWSARRAWLVVGVTALITLGAVGVLLNVEPNVETDIQAGYFGTGDAQANAFRDLRTNVAGVNSEIVLFELKDNARHGDEAVTSVTDLEALRAQEELFQYVKSEFAARTGHDKVLSHTSLPYFVKLIYAQFPNGGYRLPDNEGEKDVVLELLRSADSTGAVALYHSDDLRAAVMFIIYDPDTTHISKKETGGIINEIIGEYRGLKVGETGPGGSAKNYDLWKNEYFDSWGVQSWIYRIDEQVKEESVLFIGVVFAFLAITLMFLFRNIKRTAIAVSTVAIILLWTLAGMTLGGVSIGFVSMAMFPLLLGVGVDYMIHIINEFGAERAHAESSDEAFRLIGRRGAVALLISTLTTITGFLVMISSTSPMIVEIGTATVLGIASVFVLSMTLLPALLELSIRNEAKEVFRPSRQVANMAAFFGQKKAFTILILVLVTATTAAFIPKTEYVIGTVEINLPQKELWTHNEDRAHMLDMYERFQEKIKSKGQETVITVADRPGGLATRAAMQDMIAIHKAMVADPFVQDAGGAVNSVPFILNLYALLQDGVVSAGPGIITDILMGGGQNIGLCPAELPACYPGLNGTWDDDFAHIQDWDDAQIRAAYDDMLARPEWAPLLLTFMDESYRIAWALTFVNIDIDQEATKKADDAFRAVLEKADPKVTDNHYFGTLTGVKKYNDYTNKWLTISTLASLTIVCLLVGLFTLRLRAVLAVATPMTLTFVWWLGLLPMPWVDIDLAFIFMIPIAFITSLGSDYAVHLSWNLEKQNRPRFVFQTVGKAVAYSAFTTAVSFFIFTRGAIRGSYEMFEAAVAAILLMTAATFLTIPMFYFTRRAPTAAEEEQMAEHASG
jgi:predicted RND superfamily exporter protein